MHSKFRGTTTLVTGASSGIGAEFAKQIAALGGDLILTARSADKLGALAEALAGEHKIAAQALPADLGASGGAATLWRAVEKLGIAVDHLVSNAGFGTSGPLVAQEAERVGELVRLNCEALTVLSRLALPTMLERGRGGIIHVASTAAFQPVPYMAAYGASKAFVLSFSTALSEEVRGRGVTVMALCPGPVPTGFQDVAGFEISPSQKFATLSAAETVERALEAYVDGDDVCIPGAVNFLGTLGSKLMPRRLLLKSVARLMRSRKGD